MERGLSFGSRGPQSDFARLCWRVRIQNNNHQRHATTQGVSHAAVKHPARFRGLRAPHALYCAHQPNSAVKPTPTSSACGCPPHFVLRRGLPRALAPQKPSFIQAHAYSNGIQFLKRCSALGLSFLRASPAGVTLVCGLFGLWPLCSKRKQLLFS